MKMRRAAFAVDARPFGEAAAACSTSCEEATEDGRKVVVFSFFRTVLDTVMRSLGGNALGPITGDVPPRDARR